MYFSKTFSFNEKSNVAIKLLQGLFLKLQILKASAAPCLNLFYFNKLFELIPTDTDRSLNIVGYATSTSSAHIYGGYLLTPFCSVAIKIEKPGQNVLHEYLILKHIGFIPGVQHLELWTNFHGRSTLVTSPFGVSLSSYMLVHNFSCNEVMDITFTLLCRLLAVHDKGVIHRDIKPSNVIMYQQKVYLIDFGVACLLKDQETSWAGTAIFSALSSMLGFPADPYHDYESLIYMAVYLFKRELPWSYHNKESICQSKKYYRKHPELLCEGFPSMFVEFASQILKEHHTRATKQKIIQYASPTKKVYLPTYFPNTQSQT